VGGPAYTCGWDYGEGGGSSGQRAEDGEQTTAGSGRQATGGRAGGRATGRGQGWRGRLQATRSCVWYMVLYGVGDDVEFGGGHARRRYL
jgi:hypothetical protein